MKYFFAAAVLMIALALMNGCDQQENSGHSSKESQFTAGEFDATEKKMPVFDLVSAVDGQSRKSSEFEGQVLFVTFFESWCSECREEIDDLKRVQEQFSGRDFTVIAISVPQDDPKVLQKLAEKANLNYPLLIGTGKTMENFDVITLVPVSFLVDRSGYITKKYLGHVDRQILARDIGKLLPAAKSGE